MQCMVSALPTQCTPVLTRGLRAHPLVNMSQKIDETCLRRCSIPRIPSQLCTTSHHFGNRSHDCLGPRVSHNAVTNRCLGKCQMRCYNIHVAHLNISAPIKCRHVPASGIAPLLQSCQVQISSKLRGGKDIGPNCGFAASHEVGSKATIGTLQIRYPYAQDLSQVPWHQTSHLAWEGPSVTTCPMTPVPPHGEGGLWCRHVSHSSRPASHVGGLWRRGMSRGTRPASQ
jgi:hypothetical protein